MKNGVLCICPGQEIPYSDVLEAEVMQLRTQLAAAEAKCAAAEAKCAKAEAKVANREVLLQEASERIQDLERRLANSLDALYSPRSERNKTAGAGGQLQFDLSAFNLRLPAASVPSALVEEETVLVRRKPVRRKPKKNLNACMDELPVLETIHTQTDAPVCDLCGSEMKVVGWETYRELVVIPAKLYVREYKTPVYACGDCDKNGTVVPFVHLPIPMVRPLDRCLASPETLAWLAYQKIAMSLPLYRLEKFFEQLGVPISRMTLCNWLFKVCQEWLVPLAARMHAELLQQYILHADETPLQVLHEPGRKAQTKGYVWIFCSSYWGAPTRYILFQYSASRAHGVAEEFLAGYFGFLMVDGHRAYDKAAEHMDGLFLSRCWAHCRRKWYEAVKKAKPKPNDLLAVGYAYVEKLFTLERAFAELTPAERFGERLRHIKPLLDEFHKWLVQQYQGQTAFGRAVAYTLDYWDDLYQILSDGRLPATNAAAELMARSLAVGRKNWLFSDNPVSANALMAGYSVTETAKANALKPYEYLLWVFQQMPKEWKEWCALGVSKGLDQIDALADRAFDELVGIVKQSLRTPDSADMPRKELEAAALAQVRAKIVDPIHTEVRDAFVLEVRKRLAEKFLPEHAPPECQKNPQSPRDEDQTNDQTA